MSPQLATEWLPAEDNVDHADSGIQSETPRALGEATISDAELVIVCTEKADAQHVRANFPFEEFCETSVVVGKEASLREAKPNAFIMMLGANEETAGALATWIGRPVFYLKEAVRLMNSTRLAAAIEEGGKEVQPAPAEQITPAKPTKTAKAEATLDPGRPGDNLADCDLPGDAGRAKLFIDRNGEDLRFVHVWEAWLIRRRNRWRIDRNGEIYRCALATGGVIMGEAFAVTGEAERRRAIGEATAWGQTTKISSMLALAKHDLRTVLGHREVDADPWMLGTPNGVLDLRSGQLVESAGYVTKSIAVPFDRSARCPRWERFLGEVFPEPSIREYVRCVVGYTLAGITDEHLFMFCYGSGANGKSTLLETLHHVMGDYASRAGAEIICLSKHGREPESQIAELMGQRLVIGAETAEGARLNENLIKDVTGGDTLRGRRIYESAFQFIPQCTLWLFGNYKPAISGCDDGIWRRVRLIPFLQKFESDRKDPSLKTKLRAEAPGILAWAVRACLDWQRSGLTTPETVRLAVEEYRTDEDSLADFIEECTETLLGFRANHAELFQRYQQWADRNGLRYPLSRKGLSKRLRDRGWCDKRTGRGIEWVGRRVRSTE